MPSTTISLTPDQERALDGIFSWLTDDQPTRSPQHVVAGYAGTGKTTLISYFRKELAGQSAYKHTKVAFCAFTGKAASVLRQKLQDRNALLKGDSCGTIHSLIYTPVIDSSGRIERWDRNEELDADLIVVDEGSMVSRAIWTDLLSFRKPVLALGDHGQLPPIEGGFSLMEHADYRMEHIVRQAADNPIIQLSLRIREGGGIPTDGLGQAVRVYPLHDPESAEYFENAITSSRGEYLCLCGRNRTRIKINGSIRAMLGFEGNVPQRGERVVCLKNNHKDAVYNGMVGEVMDCEDHEQHWYSLVVRFDELPIPFEGIALKYQFNKEKTLRGQDAGIMIPALPERSFGNLFDYGYVLTVHKAQGSEARRIVLFEERMRLASDDEWARWLYTAVTRARDELVVFR